MAELSDLGSVIKQAYEGEGNTNAFTDALQNKLNNLEVGATGDQTPEEIEAAYNLLVPSATVQEQEDGLGVEVRRFTPAAIANMVREHESADGSVELAYIDPHDYGAKADCIELFDASFSPSGVTSPSHTFTEEDIGKTLTCYVGWNTGDVEHTITSVSNGEAVVTPAYASSSSNIRCIFGTNNVDAFEQAMTAATNLERAELGDGTDPTAWGTIPAGGAVVMRNGSYMFSNSEARYNAGKLGGINVPRNCGLVGQGTGQTNIVLSGCHYGHGVANAGASTLAGDQRLYIKGFSVFGGRGMAGPNTLDCVHFATGMGHYSNVDNYSIFSNIQANQSRRHGFFTKGRGECLFENLWAMNAEEYGYLIDGIQDTRFTECNAGGNRLTGFYVEASASSAFNNCKSFYNGDGGGTDVIHSCNWYISNDQHSYRKGSTIYVGCESQESRGSGWVIDGGLCQFIGCLSSDPDRLGSGTRPDIKAGIHLREDGSMNVFEGFYVRPALGLDWTNENHYGGDYAVYIERNGMVDVNNSNYERHGPRGNKGSIYTLEPTTYNVAKIGGPGTTNGLNGLLRIDGEYLLTDVPGAPTNASAYLGDDQVTRLSWDAPENDGGRSVVDYKIEYKLSTDSVYTEFDDGYGTNTTEVLITGLALNQIYDFKIYAKNSNGYSTPLDFQFDNAQTVPGQVPDIKGVLGSTEIYLTWGSPSTGGSVITDYVVEYKESSSGTWLTFTDGASTATSAHVTGLTDSTSYDFRISAVNGVGTGTPSVTLTRTPDAYLATFTKPTMLGLYHGASFVTDTGGLVDTWGDRGGYGDDLTSSGTSRPTTGTVTLNGINAIDLDGSNDKLAGGDSLKELPTGDFTFTCVYKLDGNLTTQQAILASNDSNFLIYLRGDGSNDILAKCGSGDASITGPLDTNLNILVVKKEGSNITLYVNGTASSTVAASDLSTLEWLTVGEVNIYYGHVSGAMPFISAYTEALSSSEINTQCNALASEFGGTWTNIA